MDGLSADSTVVEAGKEAEFLDLLLKNLPDGISILDRDLRYRLISNAVFNELGLSKSDLKVGHPLSRCHELMVENGLLTPDMVNNTSLSSDGQKKRLDGGHGDSAQLVKLGNGTTQRLLRRPIGDGYTLSIATDVSELVEMDEILEASLLLGRAGYWMYDFETKAYTLSDSLFSYFSKEDTDLIAEKGFLTVVHRDDRHVTKSSLTNMVQNGDRFSFEVRVRTVTGKYRWSMSHGELIRDSVGRPLKIRTFVRDVHEEHLRQEELEAAKDSAIAASKAKSEFLANMSHEIRTPMNGVLGMTELLASSDIDDRQREYVNVISNSATALLTIINDILDFSKIEAGALEIDPIPFDLKTSISDVTALLVASAQDKGLELIINYDSKLPRHFIGDAGRIRQVVTNLVGNAIKFTDQGHIRVDVNVTDVKNVNVVTIDVKDTGIGIAPDKVNNIFEKFTQADGSTTRLYGGTGLGLTISKRIVEMMNGRMSVTSTLGEGSTFRVRIPLPSDPDAREETFETELVKGSRVLIVDDIRVNRRLLSRQCENWEMTADCVDDGLQAAKAIQTAQAENRPYDLILLDYLMPGMNGQEVARVLDQQAGLEIPPIIMLSSCDQPVSSMELAKIGIESYLVKPVRERRLFDTIVRVLSRLAEQGADKDKASITAHNENSPQPAPSDIAEPTPTKKQTILVAEDFPLNQDVVRLMLSDTPFQPVFAENGKVAVDMFTQSPDAYPVIIMDVSMPVMDGYEATRMIRAWEVEHKRDESVPIIALTGHALKNDRDVCIAAGMNDYLTKPVKQSELLEKLEHFSGRAVMTDLKQAV